MTDINFTVWPRHGQTQTISAADVFNVATGVSGVTHVRGPKRGATTPRMLFSGSENAMGELKAQLRDSGWGVEADIQFQTCAPS